MVLNARSEKNLQGVHPDLISVVRKAAEITAVDFIVTEGVRSADRQKALVQAGAAQTLRSRHIPTSNQSNLSCAVDLAALVRGSVRWDWPLYDRIAIAMKLAAHAVNVQIEWGGDWKTFKDGPHYQLPWSAYP